MKSSAPSSVSVAVPWISTYEYGFSGSAIASETRGSRRRLRSLARPAAVLNAGFPSSTSIHTGDT